MNIPKKEPIAIPIIFVPGIMGSRLARGKTMVWDPDDAGIKELVKSAKKRKEDLIGDRFDKNYLHVAGLQGSTIDADTDHWKKHHINTVAKAKMVNTNPDYSKPMRLILSPQPQVRRGWGTVLWRSYGYFLKYIEGYSKAITQSTGNCHIYMPVYAHGYNWTASSLDSGKKLAETIDDAMFEMAELGIPCEGVMIITHSMGGFVARAASVLHDKKDDIHAICHIAMPDNGSPATYKRMKLGHEGAGFEARFLGRTGPEVTAVLGHAPGGLELLPNEHYKQADKSMDCWLSLKDNKGNKENLYKVSAEEVYVEPNKWYRLVRPDWLYPENPFLGELNFIRDYVEGSLEKALKFHNKLGEKKHPNTWIIYGTGGRAYDKINWMLPHDFTLVPGAKDLDEIEVDIAKVGTTKASEMGVGPAHKIQGAKAKGDGTVHAGAGKYSSNARKRIPLETSADHQGLMKNSEVMNNVNDFIRTVLKNFAKCIFIK